MPITLREATEADSGFLLLLYASTRAAELANTGWDPPTCAAFVRMQFDLQQRSYRLRYPDSTVRLICLGAHDGAAPVGRLWTDFGADAVRLIDLSVLPAQRGMGIGTACLRSLLASAAMAGLPVHLQVETTNPARRLYLRLGFAPQEVQGLHLAMQWPPPSVCPDLQPEETCDEQA